MCSELYVLRLFGKKRVKQLISLVQIKKKNVECVYKTISLRESLLVVKHKYIFVVKHN